MVGSSGRARERGKRARWSQLYGFVASVFLEARHSSFAKEFYAMMGGMDVCVPAFAENGYYEHQASSTFVMAVECNVCRPIRSLADCSSTRVQVPIVVTERMRKSYTYANDDRAVITRPAAMREVAALLALRTGDASEFLNAHPSSHHVRDSVHDMMSRGWQRSKEDFQRFKRGIWRENDYVVERLLRDY